jgi:hypothetical protein
MFMSTRFDSLAQLCEELSGTAKRLEMVGYVADFLKHLQPSEVQPAVSMILGRPLSLGDKPALEVSWSTLSSIIKRLTNI